MKGGNLEQAINSPNWAVLLPSFLLELRYFAGGHLADRGLIDLKQGLESLLLRLGLLRKKLFKSLSWLVVLLK